MGREPSKQERIAHDEPTREAVAEALRPIAKRCAAAVQIAEWPFEERCALRSGHGGEHETLGGDTSPARRSA